MDAVGISLIAAAAAALGASVSGLVAVRSQSRGAPRRAAAPEAPPTATQAIPHVAIPAPASAAPPVVEEIINLAPAPAPPPASQPALQLPPKPAPAAAPKRASIHAVKGTESKEWPIGETRMIIGRSQDAECFIPSLTVSRKHAIIERKGDQIILSDCGSRNGTYVRGVRIDQPVVLRNGDTIEMGEIVLRIAFA